VSEGQANGAGQPAPSGRPDDLIATGASLLDEAYRHVVGRIETKRAASSTLTGASKGPTLVSVSFSSGACWLGRNGSRCRSNGEFRPQLISLRIWARSYREMAASARIMSTLPA
jgi:hypothetical protein